MNLVDILSHDKTISNDELPQKSQPDKENNTAEDNKTPTNEEQVRGFALTVKSTFVDNITSLCTQIRPKSFLQYDRDDAPFQASSSADQLVFIQNEAALIGAIDSKEVKTWNEFEYVLSVVIENRLLIIYRAHLEKCYQTQLSTD